MSLAELIRHFENQTSVPIAVEEVAEQVRLRSSVDQIRFISTDTNAEIYSGHLVKYEMRPSPYSEMQLCCDIYFSNDLDESEKRLVICKELIHILDLEALRIASREDVSHLISQIVLNPKFQTHDQRKAAGPKVGWDRINGYCAPAVLFPFAVRQHFLKDYQSGRIRLGEIAKIVRIPPVYAQLVMSEFWPEFYEALLAT
jgi:hypothetical protein